MIGIPGDTGGILPDGKKGKDKQDAMLIQNKSVTCESQAF
jgi:hypothetical protein